MIRRVSTIPPRVRRLSIGRSLGTRCWSAYTILWALRSRRWQLR